MSNEAIQQLATLIADQMQGGNAPNVNRGYSQEAISGVVQALSEKGYDKDSIEAAKVFMGGSQKLVEKTVESALARKEAELNQKTLIREAEGIIKSVLKEHYADTEYGAQLKKMEKSIRVDAVNKFTADQALMQRFNNGELPETELEKIIDDTVDEYLKDVLGKDRKSQNTAIKSKPTSSEGAVAGNEDKSAKGGPSGDFDRDLASLSSEQRQMYDAKLIRLTQRLGRDPEKAKKEALESALEMPAYFPTRGLTANI
jgi:hypothetical protein